MHEARAEAGVPPAERRLFGPLFRRLFRLLFEPVAFPPEVEAELRELSRRGALVYVMRSAGLLSVLYFNWAFARRGLPMVRVVAGLPGYLRFFASLLLRSRLRSARDFPAALARGEAGMVFLRRPAMLRSRGTSTEDPFPGLLELQASLGKPIYLVPQLLVFKRAAVRLRPGVADTILGSAEVPGKLHTLVSFLFNHRRSFVKVGRPIDLAAVHEASSGIDRAVVVRKVRGSLAVGLSRELRVVVGPPHKGADRMIAETLRDRILRDELARLARESGRSQTAVERYAKKCLREVAARNSPAVLDAANMLGKAVFARLYEGINVDEEGLRKAADAARRAPLVFCPTHRSHVDYLLVSHVLFERGMTPPLVAAGANLSFWPLGPIFRRGGAFFIRRSFKGDKIYGAAVAAYIRKLARDGYTQEFYPEGGRTRTGRILRPKYGLIAMEVDAWLAGARDDLHFVPVAIDYEKLIEAGAYARELAGGEKPKESATALLKLPAVLVRRWGRVHVQVDEPISVAAFAASRGFAGATADAEERRHFVQALAHRIAYGMGRVQTITASALVAAALLAHRRRELAAADLAARVDLLRQLAARHGARFSPGTRGAPADPLLPGPMARAVAVFAEDELVKTREAAGETVYQVAEEARPRLAFYKNNIVHHFQDEAVLAIALRSFPGAAAPRGELLERIRRVSRLLKLELSFRSDRPLAETVDEAARNLADRGLLVVEDDRLAAAADGEGLAFLADLLAEPLESYRLAFGGLDLLGNGAAYERKELAKKLLERGRALYHAGKPFAVEALSRPNLEHAVAWLEDAGHLRAVGRGRVSLARELRDPEARAALLAGVEELLPR
jgi:glycerol-3-phosphate O-acyltransferase